MNLSFPGRLNPVFALLFVACLALFSGLNGFELRESTEPREAGIAADMLQHGQFLVPTLNGRPFLEKPPLSYWLQAASIDVFGYEPFAPRIPSALAVLATVMLFAFFYRRAAQAAWLTFGAGTLLVSMEFFWAAGRTAGQDALLAFGISMALFSFFVANETSSKAAWFAYSAGIAVATLTKGVVGLAIPGVVIFAYLMAETLAFNKRFRFASWLAPALWALAGLLPIIVWLACLYGAGGFDPVREIVWANSVGRFQGDYAQGAHAEPWYYYIRQLPAVFQPWTFLLYYGAWNYRAHLLGSRRTLFLVCWLAAPFILLSLSAGKRPSYLLMLYPAAAALLAEILVHWAHSAGADAQKRTVKYLGGAGVAFLGTAGLYIAYLVAAAAGNAAGGTVALLGAAAFFFAFRAWAGFDLFRLYAATVAGFLIAYVSYYSFVMPQNNANASAQRVMQTLGELSGGQPAALYRPTERMEGAASYYLRRRVPVIQSEEALARWLSLDKDLVVLVAEESGLDLTRYNDRAQVAYGKQKYHYISGR